MTHIAISDHGTDVRYECESEPEAVCRWECDCEEWNRELGPGGSWWHADWVLPWPPGPLQREYLHPMRPCECTVLPWLENQDAGPVEAGDMEAYRIGRHAIEVEWEGVGIGYIWDYAEGES